MPLQKTSHSLRFVGDYLAPELFPEEAKYRRYSEKRSYVSNVMDSLAARDALFLTDVSNQPRNMIALANDVINGVSVSDAADGQMVAAPLPPSLAGYKVKIKSMNGQPLKWKGGREAGRAYGGETIKEKHDLMEDWFWTSDSQEEDLPVSQAWQALRQLGQHCRNAPSAKSRELNWKIEEVKPPGYDEAFTEDGDGEVKPMVEEKGLRRKRAS